MKARTSTGSDARCGSHKPLMPAPGSRQYLTLRPTQAKILEALQCMEPCPAADLMKAANVSTKQSLRVHISGLRKHGYEIDVFCGCEGLRETTYSLRGTV